ncbi:hypothetical protein D3C81_2052280 [compost metagenome]
MLRWVTIHSRPSIKCPSDTASAGFSEASSGTCTGSTTNQHSSTITAAASISITGPIRLPFAEGSSILRKA